MDPNADRRRRVAALPVVIAATLLVLTVSTRSGAQADTTSSSVATVPGTAATGGDALRVVTRIAPPFVIDRGDGTLEGYSEDLLQLLSAQLGRRIEQQVVASNVPDLLDRIVRGEADLGISAISITSERENRVDFSQPMFAGGLQVLTRPGHAESPSVWRTVVDVLTSKGARRLGLAILLILIALAHLIFFVERRHPNGVIEDDTYFPGIFEAAWWAFTALVAQEQALPRRWLSRLATTLWLFFGVTFLALFTAAISTALTVEQIKGGIGGLNDPKDKPVATVEGSTAADYLRTQGFRPTLVAAVQDAFDALDAGEVDGVVFDAPILQYYATHAGQGKAAVVGDVFRPENYGIAFPVGSPLRKRVNEALLTLAEQGRIAELDKKWFTPD